MNHRAWRILAAVALVLASAAIALSAFLFTALRDVSVQGCNRQNHLREELNLTLQSFDQKPRFNRIDCKRAYSLRLPLH